MHTMYDSVIEQIVQGIYLTMLGKELVRVEDQAPSDNESLLATIQISGQWMGSVVLALSPDVARGSAMSLMNISDEEVTDADLIDTAAELVNMVGGNLKSLLPGPSFLSLPAVVSGSDFGLRLHDAQLIDDVQMACECGVLRIRLYVKTADE